VNFIFKPLIPSNQQSSSSSSSSSSSNLSMWQIKFENSFSTKTQFIDLGLRILREIQSSSSSIISISSSKNDEIKREEGGDDKSKRSDGRSFQTSKAGFLILPKS